MDLTVRDWMVIVGVVLILAVLLDAYRRIRTERRAKVRMSMNRNVTASASPADESLQWLKELPNGGARVVGREEIERATAQSRENAQHNLTPETSAEEDHDFIAGMSSSDEPENLDWLDNMGAEDSEASRAQETARRNQADPEVFMVNVVSREVDGFKGEDILHILLACDLRFGEMNFFHRHELEAGRGPIQFSVANMVQPGVFDIDNMSDFSTSGLVFFLSLPGPVDMIQAFDYMLETAQAVARNLGGDVLDETRSVITKQTLEHARQKIRDLERRMLASAAR
ncbi:MAG: cell division protein ZipA [Halioglobus sp.]|jgi:cell division protein ZipA